MIQTVLIGAYMAIQASPAALPPATCEVQRQARVDPEGAVGPRVSNLELIDVTACIPRRPTPSDSRLDGLAAAAVVSAIDASGAMPAEISSAVILHGGTGSKDRECVSFYLDIPIDKSEREAATRRYLDEVVAEVKVSGSEAERTLLPDVSQVEADVFDNIFRQHRLGQFEVECRVLDRGRVVGVGHTKLEVVFDGHFFEQDAFRPKK